MSDRWIDKNTDSEWTTGQLDEWAKLDEWTENNNDETGGTDLRPTAKKTSPK